jgi:hypothetical protein
MARKTIAERIAQLDAQKKSLQARAGKQERANDIRRKVLLGALVLHRLDSAGDAEFSKRLGDWLRRELPGFLSRDSDKALLSDLIGGPQSGNLVSPPNGTASVSSTSDALKAVIADTTGEALPISATAEKPTQQTGKTMAEVMAYSDEA